jgi:hypothetical protein
MGVSMAATGAGEIPTAATVTPRAEVLHTPLWVEQAHGVESVVATIGLIVAAWWAWRGDWLKTRADRNKELELLRRESQQRDERLRWDQAKLAREINGEFLEDLDAREVLHLVDCDTDTFDTTDSANLEFTYTFNLQSQQDVKAMDVSGRAMSDKEAHLRECFDAWFYWMALMEQHLKGDLILQEDIEYPTDYYLECLRSNAALYNACLNHIDHYRLSLNIRAFLKRFELLSQRRRASQSKVRL